MTRQEYLELRSVPRPRLSALSVAAVAPFPTSMPTIMYQAVAPYLWLIHDNGAWAFSANSMTWKHGCQRDLNGATPSMQWWRNHQPWAAERKPCTFGETVTGELVASQTTAGLWIDREGDPISIHVNESSLWEAKRLNLSRWHSQWAKPDWDYLSVDHEMPECYAPYRRIILP